MKADRLVSIFLCFAVLVLFCSTSFAKSTKTDAYTETRYSVGYRSDTLDWTIAGTGGTPNILSELTWDNLSSIEFKVSSIYNNHFYLRTSFDYAFIYDGDNQDSDFTGNDRTGEYSRSNNNADSGALWDASIGIGKSFKRKSYDFALLGGFSVHQQLLRITDGFQTLCVSPCVGSTGPFAGLDSSYDTIWYGPWVGVDFRHLSTDKKLSAFSNLELHYARYRAEADWNLRADFQHPKSFEHEAYGAGLVLNAGFDYAINKSLFMGLELDSQTWVTGEGTDRTFFSSGAIGVTKLNEVNWSTYSLLGTIRFAF